MKNIKLILITVLGAVLFIIFGIFLLQAPQNKAISLEEQVNSSYSDIKVQEKRRVDLLYNLVDCVKQYDDHEAQTLKNIVDGRTPDSEEVNATISFVAEAYPELKSDANYRELMNELSVTENKIASYRETYNTQVKQYRRYIQKFPQRIFLNIAGYEPETFKYLEYEVSEDAPTDLFE